MEKRKISDRYSPEIRLRAVRMVLAHQRSYETQSAAVSAIAFKISSIPVRLRVWVRQANEILCMGETLFVLGPSPISRRNSTARSSRDQLY